MAGSSEQTKSNLVESLATGSGFSSHLMETQMIIGMAIGFAIWAVIFLICILYAAFAKKHYINVWFLLALLLGFLSAGFIYGAIYQLVMWVVR